MELEWGTEPRTDSVDALIERFGSGNVVAMAVDDSVLFVKRLGLPPLSPAERRQMIALDPGRYFPVRDEALVAGVRDDDLVVALPRSLLDTWLDALGELGSIERVEPVPTAVVRHLAANRVPNGLVILPNSHDGGVAVARVTDGSMETLRRVPAGIGELVDLASEMVSGSDLVTLHPWDDILADELAARLKSSAIRPVPRPPGVPEDFAAAHGALLGLNAGPELTLASPALERRIRTSAARRTVVHTTGLVAALILLGAALDHRRGETLQRLEGAVATAEAAADPVLALQDQATALAADVTLISQELRTRANPLDVLLELTRLLPPDAYLTRLAASGKEWELNGLARDAASLVAILERSDLLTDVRFRTATTRIRVLGDELENFSLVFRHVPSS